MTFIRRTPTLLMALLFGAASLLQAQDAFESHITKLADDKYAVRMEAKKALVELCSNQQDLIRSLHRLISNNDADPEQRFIAKQIIEEVFDKEIFVERGAIGFYIGDDMVLRNVEANGPGTKAGMRRGMKLVSVAGESVEGKTPRDIYAIVHSTRPGTKLEMEFVDKDGENRVLHPVVAPRSTIRSSENVEQRRATLYKEWMERMGKELDGEEP